MGWISRAGLALLAMTGAFGVAFVADREAPDFATHFPVTANVFAGVLWTAFGSVLVTQMLGWRERRRWAGVAGELVIAIGDTWDRARRILVLQFSPDDPEPVRARIEAAEKAWAALRRQDEEQPADVRGTAAARWCIPDEARTAISEMCGVWLSMWPAGLAGDQGALHRRLTRVLLPRLGTEGPGLISSPPALVSAGRLFEFGAQAVERGNRLMALIAQSRGRRTKLRAEVRDGRG